LATKAIQIAALLGGLLATPALGQAVQPPTREQVRRDQLDDRLSRPGDGVTVDPALARAPCPLADAQYADIRFTLSSASFAGIEEVEPGLLDPAWRGSVGRELPIAAVCDIRDRASAILNAAGYVASVQVPPQRIEGGAVQFDVIVARMTGLVIRGEPGPSGEQLRRQFEKLRSQPVFRRGEAERSLMLARDIPGMDVRLSLARDVGPDARPGDLIGIVDVVMDRFQADFSVQNYSAGRTGPFGALLRAQINGITGLADLTELSVYSSQDPREQVVLQGRHEFGIGTDGLRAGINAVHAWTQPDVTGPDVFDSTTFVGTLYASYPLVRAQVRNVVLSAGFDWIDQRIDFSGLDFSSDKLRVPFVRIEGGTIDRASAEGRGGYTIAEPRLAMHGSIELRHGIGGFGASKGCGPGFIACTAPGVVPIARFDADPSALVIRYEGLLDFRPSPLWLVSLAPRAQYSPDALLSYEQFSGGNFTIGRGFDPGELSGDSGAGARLEFAYGTLQPETPDAIAWQGFVFWDTATAWIRNVSDDPFTINSVGAGARFNIARRAFLEVVGAVPLDRAPFETKRDDFRLLLNLSIKLGS
jgi:hemolysin activation/secretion protein